ncbi:FAD-dependent oxidoreductase [uncultured Desulfovibrio sp.]|uniref:FAD-dependent oxidoreductase n=1 Tax=uncultured Desulfovibrio sp. TaxID=167968 RepID=UPI00261223E9|nr:FAD-dependent oxidoreductase [uncultured Desulfovibrio sp.]
MKQLAYGVWGGIAYDNRKTREVASPPNLDLEVFDHFNEGNPVSIFMSDRGFLVFDARASLLRAMLLHFRKVASESCGKCTPCRAGAPLIRNLLENALAGEAVHPAAMLDLARQMAATSLCGVGKTGPLPLIAALEHFSVELLHGGGAAVGGFYTAITAPCIEACPGLVNIPRYIDYIRDGHDDLAANTVLRHYPLVGSCGRVCVRSCEKACRRGRVDEPISIRNLKRYAADSALASGVLKPARSAVTRKARVAVVGAGPVGISCAYHLLERGYPVDIFEAKAEAGGMIRYGIPIYRLPKNTLKEETDIVAAMGGNFLYNRKLGRDFTVDDLFSRGYRAVFIGCGCPQGAYLGMDGEDTGLPGYENGIGFLERVYEGVEAGNPPVLEGDAVIVGGGNVAMDCCRAAVRVTTGRVHLIYRRTEADAPCDPEEIAAAREEGVEFHFLCGQKNLVVENGRITGLRVVDMERTEPDDSGRRGVRPIEGTEHIIPCSCVIAAIGQKTDPAMLTDKDGIERDRKGCIIINSAHETSRPGVFAGGDCTSGPRAKGPTTMIMGMGHAYFAARSIDRYLSDEEVPFDSRWRMSEWIAQGKLFQDGKPVPLKRRRPRVTLHELPAGERARNFREVEQTMSKEEAWAEAARCMRCYRVLSVVTEKPIPGADAAAAVQEA